MKFKFASSQFLNSAPLIEGLLNRPGVTLKHGPPAAMAALVRNGTVDAAIVPAVDYLLDNYLKMIDGLGVCADGEVRSVRLRCHRPLADARRIAADPASRTSNLLARILLTEYFHSSAEVVPFQEINHPDAEIVIGDRALTTPAGAGGDYDLAAVWKTLTGLPFVFAVWVHRIDHPHQADLAAIAHESLAMGRKNMDVIASRYATSLGLTPAECRDYLTCCVYFQIGDREKQAMGLFRNHLTALKLTANNVL